MTEFLIALGISVIIVAALMALITRIGIKRGWLPFDRFL